MLAVRHWVDRVFGGLFVVLPLVALVSRVDWAQLIPLITSEASVAALLLSLRTSLIATALCIVLGIPMAVVLATGQDRRACNLYYCLVYTATGHGCLLQIGRASCRERV